MEEVENAVGRCPVLIVVPLTVVVPIPKLGELQSLNPVSNPTVTPLEAQWRHA